MRPQSHTARENSRIYPPPFVPSVISVNLLSASLSGPSFTLRKILDISLKQLQCLGLVSFRKESIFTQGFSEETWNTFLHPHTLAIIALCHTGAVLNTGLMLSSGCLIN